MIKINERIISLPPYLSTSWDNVLSLQVDEDERENFVLIVKLVNGDSIRVPGLSSFIIKEIFSTHATYLEKYRASMQESEDQEEDSQSMPASLQEFLELFTQSVPHLQGSSIEPIILSIPLGSAESVSHDEEFPLLLKHNPAFSNAPKLPKDKLQKIFLLAKEFKKEFKYASMQPYPKCNCFHCQIARAISYGLHTSDENQLQEEIKEEDLQFREWDINEIENNLFRLTHLSPSKEQYIVNLSRPIHCSCGKKNCEHIKMILAS